MEIFEFRNEVWNSDPDGDWGLAAFDIDIPDKVLLKLETNQALSVFEKEDMNARVEKGFQECVRQWLSMRGSEGEVPTTRPYLRPGFFLIPDEPESLGKRRMYIAARWKREHPLLMGIDDVAKLAAVGYVDQGKQIDEFFDQMSGISKAPLKEIKAHMASNAEAPEKAREEAAALAESDYKDTHRISGVKYNRTAG